MSPGIGAKAGMAAGAGFGRGAAFFRGVALRAAALRAGFRAFIDRLAFLRAVFLAPARLVDRFAADRFRPPVFLAPDRRLFAIVPAPCWRAAPEKVGVPGARMSPEHRSFDKVF
jgi:hypothetical protein